MHFRSQLCTYRFVFLFAALHCAIEENSRDICQMLLQKGASVTLADSRGETVVDYATREQALELLESAAEAGMCVFACVYVCVCVCAIAMACAIGSG